MQLTRWGGAKRCNTCQHWRAIHLPEPDGKRRGICTLASGGTVEDELLITVANDSCGDYAEREAVPA